MTILNDNLDLEAPLLIDSRSGPYADLSTALLSIESHQRSKGLTVIILDGTGNSQLYWFKDDIGDSDLIPYNSLDNLSVRTFSTGGGENIAEWGEVILLDASGGNHDFNIPDSLGNENKIIILKRIDDSTNIATIQAYLTQFFDGISPVLTFPMGPLESVILFCNGSNPYRVAQYYDNLGVILSEKAPLDSPAFTGTPTAPTPTGGDDSTKLATTEFVTDALASISVGDTINGVNITGSTITKGSVVHMTSYAGQSDEMYIVLANATNPESYTVATPVGIVKADITNGATGEVQISGFVLNLDTSAFSTGEDLYLSTTAPGGLTNVLPEPPNKPIYIGKVNESNATTGSILLSSDRQPPLSYYDSYPKLAFTGINVTGDTLAPFTVVNLVYDSVTDNAWEISQAQANNIVNCGGIVGLMIESTPDATLGSVLRKGFITGIDTTIFGINGDILYLSAADEGITVTTKPTGEGNYVIKLGEVVVSDATNGILWIDVEPLQSVIGNNLLIAEGKDEAISAIGAILGFGRFDGSSGSPTFVNSYNFGTISKNGTGDWTIEILVDASDGNFSALITAGQGTTFGVDDANRSVRVVTSSFSAGSFRFAITNATGGSFEDANVISVLLLKN